MIESSFSTAQNQHVMLRDAIRVMTYRRAIERHVAGKTVIEIGCGSGVLSVFAARAGAKRVIALEETSIAQLARDMVIRNRCEDIVEIHQIRSTEFHAPDRADVIIHEILGQEPFEEGLITTIRDARRRLLRDGGRLLPHRIEVCCVGFEHARSPWLDKQTMLCEARDFSHQYEIDFSALVDAIERIPERHLVPPLAVGHQAELDVHVLTDEVKLCDVDLHQDAALATEFPVETVASRSGLLTGVFLYFRVHLDETLVLTNSPFARLTHWARKAVALPRAVAVASGAPITLVLRYEDYAGRERLTADTR